MQGDYNHRCFPNKLSKIPLTNEQKELLVLSMIEYINIVRQRWESFRKHSIYIGTGGVALMLYRVAKLLRRQPTVLDCVPLEARITPEECLEEAFEILDAAARRKSSLSEIVTFLEGLPGILAVLACVESAMGKNNHPTLRRLLKYADDALDLPKDDCEILYGRCGYLSALNFVRQELKDPEFGCEEAVEILAQVVQRGQRNAMKLSNGSPLVYYWGDKIYLGAAHGLVGILHIMFRFKNLFPAVDKALNVSDGTTDSIFASALEDLLKQHMLPSGNLRSSQESTSDRLVHWCHGCPGAVMLLCAIYGVTPSERYRSLITSMGDCLWKRGLLKKGLGLCHGIGGNGLAMLHIHRTLGLNEWLGKSEQFALFGIDHFDELRRVPDRPYSLFEGLAGYIYFLCDILTPDASSFPGMD